MIRIVTAFVCSLFLAFNLLVGNAWATGNFSQTCQNITLEGSDLTAECAQLDGYTYIPTTLDLDDYIGNINGELQWGDHWFSHTCESTRVEGNRLMGECEKRDGYTLESTFIDLDEYIANIDGELTFEYDY